MYLYLYKSTITVASHSERNRSYYTNQNVYRKTLTLAEKGYAPMMMLNIFQHFDLIRAIGTYLAVDMAFSPFRSSCSQRLTLCDQVFGRYVTRIVCLHFKCRY